VTALRAASVLVLFAAPAAAQQKEPLPIFAADLRGIFARHKAEPSTATELGVAATNVPTRSLGLVGGGHVYLLRGRRIALGLGATMLMGGGSKTLEPTATTTAPTTGASDTPTPTVRRHFRSINPEISLNFGHRNGWSYISGGFLGRSTLYLDREDAPATNAPRRKTLTYGAGARWFTTDHLAFSAEVRWYSVAEQRPPAGSTLVLEPRTTLMVLSGGISIK
jgi:opacity protein-like surface antigen